MADLADDELKAEQVKNLQAERALKEQEHAFGEKIIGQAGFAKGGAVYKNSHPDFTEFSQSADSSLLAKGRRR